MCKYRSILYYDQAWVKQKSATDKFQLSRVSQQKHIISPGKYQSMLTTTWLNLHKNQLGHHTNCMPTQSHGNSFNLRLRDVSSSFLFFPENHIWITLYEFIQNHHLVKYLFYFLSKWENKWHISSHQTFYLNINKISFPKWYIRFWLTGLAGMH